MKRSNAYLTDVNRRAVRLFAMMAVVVLLVPGMAFAQPQAPVALGQASGFTVLAASLISSIPTSEIIGDVGLSPATGSEITGLTAGEVTGIIYTVDAGGPAGSVASATMLTAAQGDLTIAFNDAAARQPTPVGDFLNPGVGDIGGLTLVPGLYKFTDGVMVSISGSDVTLSGSSTDVWIFQIATTLTVDNGIKVILAGGALAENVFWQVGTSATLGTNSVFKGTIMADQSISLNTGANVEGRLLARIAAVTLDASIVTEPGTTSSVSERVGGVVPQQFALGQNYPNPFNPSTKISFELSIPSHVLITVIDLLGQDVATLVDRNMEPGSYQTEWDASRFASGVYYVRMDANNFNATRQVTLIK